MIEVIKDFSSCKHTRRSYYEYDTGYSEYMCDITSSDCFEECCPLCFKYSVTKNGEINEL